MAITPQVTIIGNFIDFTGVATQGYVIATVVSSSSAEDFRIVGTGIFVPKQVVSSTGTSFSLLLYGNDVIADVAGNTNTYYHIECYDTSGKLFYSENYNLSGSGTLSLVDQAPLSPVPVTVPLPSLIPVSQGGTGVAKAPANMVFAGPTSGSPLPPSFRSLVSGDFPATLSLPGDLIVGGSETLGGDLTVGGDIESFSINGTIIVAKQAGATAGQRLATCIANLPATGGICDARSDVSSPVWDVDPFNGTTKPIHVIFGSATIAVNVNVTVPDTTTLQFVQGSILSIATGKTFIIRGPILAGTYPIFQYNGTGKVSFNGAITLPVAYPQWWGAQGNCTITNDSPFIQAAIDALSTERAGLLVLKTPDKFGGAGGCYRIENTLILPNPLTIKGDSQFGTVLTAVGAGTSIFQLSTGTVTAPNGFLFEDLYLQGPGATSTAPGMIFINAHDNVLNRLAITGFNDGISFRPGTLGSQSSYSNKVLDCKIFTNNRYGIEAQSGTHNLKIEGGVIGDSPYALYIIDSADPKMIGVDVEGTTVASVYADEVAVPIGDNFNGVFIGNHFENNTGKEFLLGSTHVINGVRIIGNTFGSAATTEPIRAVNVSNLTVTGNLAYNWTGARLTNYTNIPIGSITECDNIVNIAGAGAHTAGTSNPCEHISTANKNIWFNFLGGDATNLQVQNRQSRFAELVYTGDTYPAAWVTGGPVGEQGVINVNSTFPLVFATNNTAQAFIDSTGVFQYGGADAAVPTARTIQFQSVVTGTSNTTGANATIKGSNGTGTGGGGSIIFQTGAIGGAGSTPDTMTTALTINNKQQLIGIAGTATVPSYIFGPAAGTYGLIGDTNKFYVSNQTNAVAGMGEGFGPVGGMAVRSGDSYVWSANASTVISSSDTFISRRAAAGIMLGASDAAAPVAQTLSVQSVISGTSNTAGATFTIQGSNGTGTGGGGSIVFQTGAVGGSGTSPDTQTTVLTLDKAQLATFAGAIKVTGAFTPNAAAGTDVGTTALPFANFWLGTAATNNFKFQPASTTGARIITIADPLSPTTVALPMTIGNGTASMTTAGIGTGACGTTVTVAATGVLTTDTIDISHNAAATNGNGGNLILNAWPTAGNVNFNYCNPSAGTVTPTAMTINWSVRRP